MVVQVIPYKTFKERLKLVKQYEGAAKIIIYDQYIYVEMKEDKKGQ